MLSAKSWSYQEEAPYRIWFMREWWLLLQAPQNISSGTRSRCSQNHRNLPLAGLTHSLSPTFTEASCRCSCEQQQDDWQRAILVRLVLGQSTVTSNGSKKFFHGRTCLEWSRCLVCFFFFLYMLALETTLKNRWAIKFLYSSHLTFMHMLTLCSLKNRHQRLASTLLITAARLKWTPA